MRSAASAAGTILGTAAVMAAPFFLPRVDAAAPYSSPLLGVLMAIFAAAAFAPALHEAYSRRRKVHAIIARELMKLRRIYHLSRHLAEGDTRFRMWFTELHSRLCSYLEFFAKHPKASYADSDHAFRQVSYHVYGIPDFQTKKEEALYAELLDTVADAAEARQQLKALWKFRASSLTRSSLALIAAFAVAVSVATVGVTASSASELVSPLTCGMVAAGAFLLWRMLSQADSLAEESCSLAQDYSANVAKLEFRHRDEE